VWHPGCDRIAFISPKQRTTLAERTTTVRGPPDTAWAAIEEHLRRDEHDHIAFAIVNQTIDMFRRNRQFQNPAIVKKIAMLRSRPARAFSTRVRLLTLGSAKALKMEGNHVFA
jgi:hypothetical protein